MWAFVPQAGATPMRHVRCVHFWAEVRRRWVGEDHCCKQGTESPGRRLQLHTGVFVMRRSKPQPIRNKLDLADRTQVRLVRKRLGLSDAELTSIVERIGNSIAAISKEAALQRATTLPKPDDVPPVAVITSATVGEQATRK
ncbi:DUF3606 domain-containing protein [Bradyrhizobium sp. WSM4349]